MAVVLHYAVGDTYCVQVIRTEANQIKIFSNFS